MRASTWLARVGIGGLPRGAQGPVCGGQGYFKVGDRKTWGGDWDLPKTLTNVRVTTNYASIISLSTTSSSSSSSSNTRAWRQPGAISTGLLIRGMKSRPNYARNRFLLLRSSGTYCTLHMYLYCTHLAPSQVSKLSLTFSRNCNYTIRANSWKGFFGS